MDAARSASASSPRVAALTVGARRRAGGALRHSRARPFLEPLETRATPALASVTGTVIMDFTHGDDSFSGRSVPYDHRFPTSSSPAQQTWLYSTQYSGLTNAYFQSGYFNSFTDVGDKQSLLRVGFGLDLDVESQDTNAKRVHLSTSGAQVTFLPNPALDLNTGDTISVSIRGGVSDPSFFSGTVTYQMSLNGVTLSDTLSHPPVPLFTLPKFATTTATIGTPIAFSIDVNVATSALLSENIDLALTIAKQASARPDVAITSAVRVQPAQNPGFDNFQGFDVQYTVSGTAAPSFQVGLYVSTDDIFDPDADELLRPNALKSIPDSDREPNPDGSPRAYTIRIDLKRNPPVPEDVSNDAFEVGSDAGFGAYAKDFFILAVAVDDNGIALDDSVGSNNSRPATLRSPQNFGDPFVAGAPLINAGPDNPALRYPLSQFPEYPAATSFQPANVLNFRPARTSISEIIIHAMAGSLGPSMTRFQEGTFVSAHYLVGRTGTVIQMVPEADTAFQVGDPINRSAIGIEHEDGGDPDHPGRVNPDPAWPTDDMLRSSARLAAYLARKYSIPIDRLHIRGHEEVGSHFDPGENWPWTKYMQLVSGAPGAIVSNVHLPAVDVPIDWGPLKPGPRLYYAPLGVNFQAVEPLNHGLWTAQSNIGTLEISVEDPLGLTRSPVPIARSTGSANLTLFEPGSAPPFSPDDRVMSGPIDRNHYLLRWHTDGFQIDLLGLGTQVSSGPMTIWLEPGQVGVEPYENTLFEDILRRAEEVLHTEICKALTSHFNRIGSIFDPGQTNLLVTGPAGLRTGVLPSGQVITEIPGSVYLASMPAVFLLHPGMGPYVAQLTGRLTGGFTLVASTVDLTSSIEHPNHDFRTFSGMLTAGQTKAFRVIIQPDQVDLISGDSAGPTFESLQRLGVHAQPTRLVLSFSEPLDRAPAEKAANYRLVSAGYDGRFGTRDDRAISIKSAIYDPAWHTVTLTTAQRLSWTGRYEIWVDGSSPIGITDLAENLLDGDRDGKPGGDFSAVFRGAGVFSTPSPSGFGPRPDAFVTKVYNEVLARAPEPAGLTYWAKRLASKVKPETVATAIWTSRERHILQSRHKAPQISFGHALADATKAWKQAIKVGATHPKPGVRPASSRLVPDAHR